MKRQFSPPDSASACDSRAQSSSAHKRRRIYRSESGASPRQRPCPARLAPRTPESGPLVAQQQHHAAVHEQQDEQQRIWTSRAQSILEWANNVVPGGSMSDRASQGQRRAHKASVRARSASPTKKSPEYRQNGMARAHVYVDHVYDPPADVDALRRHVLGDAYDYATQLEGFPAEQKARVVDVANEYMQHCRELARDAKGEAEWKSALLEGPVRRLVRLLGQGAIATSASDKPWRTELKPRPPTLRDLLSFSTPRLSPAPVPLTVAHPPATAAAGFNLVSPPPPTDPSETTTSYSESTARSTTEDPDPDNPLTTPKPDILLGLARSSFNEIHQVLLGEWQDNGQLLSEPQLVQNGLHFPFLIVEAKGLATSGNMMGAENQAAVGGACAINILEALQRLEPSVPLSRIVFSISTEGPLHELFVHYHVDGKYHMLVHRAWRVTLLRDCIEFVVGLALVVKWGAGEYRDALVASLDCVVQGLQSAS